MTSQLLTPAAGSENLIGIWLESCQLYNLRIFSFLYLLKIILNKYGNEGNNLFENICNTKLRDKCRGFSLLEFPTIREKENIVLGGSEEMMAVLILD